MMRTGMAATAFAFLGLSTVCAAAENPRNAQKSSPVRVKTAELREANYAVDAKAVARLAAEFRALASDPKQPDRSVAHYQAGTASSLLASFVGPGSLDNPAGDLAAARHHLEEAAMSFEAAVELAPEFPEAQAALANNYSYRASLETERAAELGRKGKLARERSLAHGPRNPRVIAAHAGFLFWAPAEVGGNRELGLARYRKALELFAAEKASDRELHAWGEPDTWAFLAMARLFQEPPDPNGAKEAIDRALALRSDFRWAQGYLLPRIQKALAAAPATAPGDAASPKQPGKR